MSSLRKRLREMAEAELGAMTDEVGATALAVTVSASITSSDLLRIAAGGKTQVLRESAIKRLCDDMEAKLLTKLNDQEAE